MDRYMYGWIQRLKVGGQGGLGEGLYIYRGGEGSCIHTGERLYIYRGGGGMCSAQFSMCVEQTGLVWGHTPLHNMSTLDFSTFIHYCN